jgi:hypothetical protein
MSKCEHERKYYVNVQVGGRVEADSAFCADCGETLYDRKREGAGLSEAQRQVLKNTLDAIRNTSNNYCNQPEKRQKELQEQVSNANLRPTGRYEMRGRDIGANTDLKNKTYGDAFRKIADIIKIMYPDGVSVERMGDFTLVVRVLDKLCRISCGDKKAFEENPWRDVCGYGLLGMEEI